MNPVQIGAAIALAFGLASLPACANAGESVVNAPVAARVANETPGLKQAIFAGGCYWGVEAVFSHIKGVTSAVSGFHGGASATAEYERVSQGDSGHAESVRVTYNPAKVRYDQLLRIFFSVATDPTQLNRQGPDEGTQYRSALVPLSPEQRQVAGAYILQMGKSHIWHSGIVTRIEPYKHFYPAAADHQDFMAKNPNHPYILTWDAPKVAALKHQFPEFYKAAFTIG